MQEKRAITQERALKFATEHGISRVFEVSAKTGFNVDQLFSTACKEMYLEKVISYSVKEN